jgi:putative membrane protein
MTTLLATVNTLATDPTYYHGGWWFFPFFWFFGFLFLIFVLRGIFWRRHWRHYQRPWGWGSEHDPRAILAARYARGEIDEQEYKQRLSVLNTPDTPRK